MATLDWDTPDAHLADDKDERHSRWLLKNCVFVSLPAGEAFFDTTKLPTTKEENRFSLFAQTVKNRRLNGT